MQSEPHEKAVGPRLLTGSVVKIALQHLRGDMSINKQHVFYDFTEEVLKVLKTFRFYSFTMEIAYHFYVL